MVFCGSSLNDGWSCDGAATLGKCASGITGFFQTAGMNRYTCRPCGFDLCEGCASICAMDKAMCRIAQPRKGVGGGGQSVMMPTVQVQQLRRQHCERSRTLQALRRQLCEGVASPTPSSLTQSIRARWGKTDKVRDEKTRACVKLRGVMVARREEIAQLLADIGKLSVQERMASDREQRLLRDVGGQAPADGAKEADLKTHRDAEQELQKLLREKEDMRAHYESQLKTQRERVEELRAEKQTMQEQLSLALLKEKTGAAGGPGSEALDGLRAEKATLEDALEREKARSTQLERELDTERERHKKELLDAQAAAGRTNAGRASVGGGVVDPRLWEELAKWQAEEPGRGSVPVAEAFRSLREATQRLQERLKEQEREQDEERERHAQKLQELSGDAATASAALNASEAERKRLEDEAAKLQAENKRFEELSGDAATASAALGACEAERRRLEEEAAKLQEERNRLKEDIAKLQGDSAGKASADTLEIERLKQENLTLQGKVQQMQEEQDAKRAAHAELVEALSEKARKADALQALEPEHQRLKAELEQARAEASQTLQRLQELQGQADTTAAELHQLRSEVKQRGENERKLLQTLDGMKRHGFYEVPEDIRGLGLSTNFLPDGRVVVGSVTPGSWASQQGILPEATLVSIGHKLAQGMTRAQMQEITKERPLYLHIHRPDDAPPLASAVPIAVPIAGSASGSSGADSSNPAQAPFRRTSSGARLTGRPSATGPPPPPPPGGPMPKNAIGILADARNWAGKAAANVAKASASPPKSSQGPRLNPLDDWYMRLDPSQQP